MSQPNRISKTEATLGSVLDDNEMPAPDSGYVTFGDEVSATIDGPGAEKFAERIVRTWNAHNAMCDALDRIFSYVSYINIHGVGEQPEPTGSPQPLRVAPEEFHRIFQDIGRLAREALAKAEQQS
jgi:hypothetical protein